MKLLLLAFQIVILFFIFRSQKVSCFSKCNPDESSALLKLKAELPRYINPNCSRGDGVDLASAHFTNFSSLTSLDLSNCKFHGEILDNILGLPKLQVLSLSSNSELTSSHFPLQLGTHLTSLSRLYLQGVDLASAHFTNFSSLTSLSLRDCKFHGEILDNISGLPKLQVLTLFNNWELTTTHYPNSNNWTSPLQHSSIDLPRLLRNGRSLTRLSIFNCQFTNSFSQHIPETHIPSNLTRLHLPSNSLNGTIPSWIYKLPYLSDLDLRQNDFSGKISNFKSTSLVSLSLSGNKLNGSVPRSIFQIAGLQTLDLSSNSLSGSLDLKELSNLKELNGLDLSSNSLSGSLDLKELSNLKELYSLSLSFNNLSLHFNNSINYTLPNLDSLALSSCNINSEFPNFLSSSKSLFRLDLSNNKIKGSVPKWLWDLGKDSLNYLNLSHNSITFMEPLPWNNLGTLDLRSNLFSGPIPISSAPSLSFLLGSKNQFRGEISTAFCNMTSLQVLDLSDNNLIGKIPSCFTNFSSTLSVLDLRRNKLHGSIPRAFSKENSLRNLNLNGNQLEGALPRSLINCSNLEVLDVGNNFLSGIIPDWIESLPHLRVLVLRSNMFHGSIENPKTQFPFKGLRIIDLSNNKFSGPLPTKLFENFEAMTNAENVKMNYMGDYYYEDSIMVTLKGNYIELVKILTIFTTIDFSCNNFTGDIPSLIGRLQSLKGLNLSHNMLLSTIPSTLGDLKNLESLDLSSNSLVGNIPWQLAANLYQLQKLNLSSNKLEGPIPRGSQFDTFTEDSYSRNLQLCGFPLSKSCHEDPTMPKEEEGDEEESNINWKVVMMGYGSGLVIGISIGYMSLYSGRFDYWLAKRSVKAQQKKINIARSWAARRRRSN